MFDLIIIFISMFTYDRVNEEPPSIYVTVSLLLLFILMGSYLCYLLMIKKEPVSITIESLPAKYKHLDMNKISIIPVKNSKYFREIDYEIFLGKNLNKKLKYFREFNYGFLLEYKGNGRLKYIQE